MSHDPNRRTGLAAVPRPVLVLGILLVLAALVAAPLIWPAIAASVQTLAGIIGPGLAAALLPPHRS